MMKEKKVRKVDYMREEQTLSKRSERSGRDKKSGVRSKRRAKWIKRWED